MKDKLLQIKPIYLLIAIAVGFALIGYRFAIKNTVEAWQLNKSLNQQVGNLQDVNYKPAYLNRKSDNLDKVMSRYATDTVSLRSNVITTIALEAQRANVRLVDVPAQERTMSTENYVLQKFSFEGDFFALCRFLDRMEFTEHIGVARVASFKKVINRTAVGNDDRLVLQLYLQTIK